MRIADRSTTVRIRGLSFRDRAIAEDTIRKVIDERIDPLDQDNTYGISILPSCDHPDELVSLVDFKHGLPEFLSQLRTNSLGSWPVSVNNLDEDLEFDIHFHGFTQLYVPDASRQISCELVAWSRLGGYQMLTTEQYHCYLRHRWTRLWIMAKSRRQQPYVATAFLI